MSTPETLLSGPDKPIPPNFVKDGTFNKRIGLLTRTKTTKSVIQIATQNGVPYVAQDHLFSQGEEHIIHTLLENNIRTIDIHQLSSGNKAKIYHLLRRNFPLVEISRLIPGENLVNVNLSGIKQINDMIGQDFCDIIIKTCKQILIKIFSTYGEHNHHKARIVKDDYKNIAFVRNSDNPLIPFFGDTKQKKDFKQQILNAIEQEIHDTARNLLPNDNFSSHTMEKLEEKKAEIRTIVMKYFDFGIGQVTIPNNADDITKLDSMRKAEISSRGNGTQANTIEIKEFSQDEVITQLQNALHTEQMIVEKWKQSQFFFDNVAYNVVVKRPNGLALSTELLRYVRKYPHGIQPNELAHMVKQYISELNQALDFISPVKKELNNATDEFKLAHTINTEMNSGFLQTKHLLKNHKGGLTKTAFFESIGEQPGINIFLDIRDMGIENLVDFHLRAQEILKLHQNLRDGKIEIHQYETQTQKLFLEAGKSVSDKFIELQKRIFQTYPDALMSFGGDEIFLFLPEQNISINEVEKNINLFLGASHQKARIVISREPKNHNTKKYFGVLEHITKLSKMVEENIEQQIIQEGGQHVNENLPNNIYINITHQVIHEIMERTFYFDNFLQQIKCELQHIKLTGNFQVPIQIGPLENQIYLSISKNTKNEVEIYIYN